MRVIDGDTLDVQFASGEIDRVRVIGINTPETVAPRKPPECFGAQASARAKELLDGAEITLESDPMKPDRDRMRRPRLLRYVLLPDGRNFEVVMLEGGYARERDYGEPYTHRDEFRAAERAARAAGRGLWSACDGRM